MWVIVIVTFINNLLACGLQCNEVLAIRKLRSLGLVSLESGYYGSERSSEVLTQLSVKFVGPPPSPCEVTGVNNEGLLCAVTCARLPTRLSKPNRTPSMTSSCVQGD